MPATNNTVVQTIQVAPNKQLGFNEWQSKLNGKIASHPGFVSLEITSPQGDQHSWSIVQRFRDEDACNAWKNSADYCDLLTDLRSHSTTFQEILTSPGLVTEVFLTQVDPANEVSYREWLAKIHSAEAKFPGFRGMYVQSPPDSESKKWLTCLQFDTPENLDKWLNSSERNAVLQELKPLIVSLESHRLSSPYAGWFNGVEKNGFTPPLWKQSMIILLALYPIVMFELKYLNPNISQFQNALVTFIGNALSVALLSWVFLPLAIYFLKDWLTTQDKKTNILGLLAVLGIYILQLILFWDLI